ncbi:MAG: hypothetical protein Aurels2KO_07550 [Aureliella sp.]
MQASRDKGETELLLGVVVPAILLCWMLFDLWAGCVYLPGPKGQRLPLQPNADSTLFWGFIAVKLGGTLTLFNWHWLANRPQFDDYTSRLHFVALGIFSIGLLAIAAYILYGLIEVFSVV